MTVTLKTLSGDEIPIERRREGLEVLFTVQHGEGEPHYLESDVEAARLVVKLSEQKKAE